MDNDEQWGNNLYLVPGSDAESMSVTQEAWNSITIAAGGGSYIVTLTGDGIISQLVIT